MWFKRKMILGFVVSSASLLTHLFFSFAFTPVAGAFSLGITDGAYSAHGVDQPTTLFGNAGIFTTLSNVMLFLVGAISVIMVIIGGLRYVISGGNTTNVGTAKNTILYAVVGLVISLLAYAIINFVIGSFVPGGEFGGTNV